MLTVAFGTKAAARKAMCMECSEKMKEAHAKDNAKTNAKTSATKKRKRVAWEYETLGIKIEDGDEEAAGNLCIQVIEQKIEAYKKLHPRGFMLAIYTAPVRALSRLCSRARCSSPGAATV